MGTVNQVYCDGCGLPVAPETYSAASGENGTVTRTLELRKRPINTGESGKYDLCQACYGKVRKWLSGLKKKADDKWTAAEPAASAVNTPTLP